MTERNSTPPVPTSQLRRYRLFRGFKRQTSNTACGLPLASHQPLHSARLGAVVWPWGLTFVVGWLVLAGHFVMTIGLTGDIGSGRGTPNLDDGPRTSPQYSADRIWRLILNVWHEFTFGSRHQPSGECCAP
jgi:hypothetical protein